jgi:hypothetical protein
MILRINSRETLKRASRMKWTFAIGLFSPLWLGCQVNGNQKPSVKEHTTLDLGKVLKDTVSFENPFRFAQDLEPDPVKNYEYQIVPFKWIQKNLRIQDTVTFIQELKKNCHLYEHESKIERINYLKKLKIEGSPKSYTIVEYDFEYGSMASCPWKNQILFDSDGKLVKVFSCDRIDVVTLFPKKNPFLICLSSTSKGNGGHDIYRIQKDTLENVFNGFSKNRPQTYDAHQDRSVNEPTEFPYQIQDQNQDGYNDLIFRGNIVMIQDPTGSGTRIDSQGQRIEYTVEKPYQTIPVSFVFLYNPKTEHFEEAENYSKKYEFIFGASR